MSLVFFWVLCTKINHNTERLLMLHLSMWLPLAPSFELCIKTLTIQHPFFCSVGCLAKYLLCFSWSTRVSVLLIGCACSWDGSHPMSSVGGCWKPCSMTCIPYTILGHLSVILYWICLPLWWLSRLALCSCNPVGVGKSLVYWMSPVTPILKLLGESLFLYGIHI